VIRRLIKTVYRIKVVGEEYVPDRGPAVLVSNHVSWLDAFLIGAAERRRIRFVMSREIYQGSRIKWLYRLMDVILISAKDPPRQVLQSLQQTRQALDQGHLVGLFAEGAITRTGLIQQFRPGLEHALRDSDYPIIPVYIGGMWGSIFSYSRGHIGGIPNRIPHRLSIHFGEPLPAASKAWQVRQKVCELSADFYEGRRSRRRGMAELFVRTAHRHWSRPCISDVTGRSLTYGQTLVAAILLARRLANPTRQDRHVAILLPPSVAAGLAHLALAVLGKVPVDLNYTASAEAREASLGQCGIGHIITSRAFVARVGLDPSDRRMFFVEDALGSIHSVGKGVAWAGARFLPAAVLCRRRIGSGDGLAAIVLSSGSTGPAKAVMLSCHNIQSNLEQIRAVYHVTCQDRFCGGLPLFHCLGLTVTFWLPLTCGASVSFVPSPLDAKAVVDCIHNEQCTLLLTAPTFLQSYLRRARRQDLVSLRDVVVGAEKMPQELADACERQLGIRPREGYGSTELSPVVSINLADVEADAIRQLGGKCRSVGQPLPGIAVKVTDPDTGQVLAPGSRGLLWVKGPNVTVGYLGSPDLTAAAIQDGWYNTEDLVTVDEDGFVFIQDRASRFSKIAGEQVSHLQVEQVCCSAVETTERVVAVTGIPDRTKGEELVVLYVPDKADVEKIIKAVNTSSLPNLWKPRRRNFIPVESIPVLATGKLDIHRLRSMAMEQTGPNCDGPRPSAADCGR
jgi:acyl-[acyl-carrier-protein]-phospholipid O-acyltransferase/long-chain-fatty-acid--[acyl-carrier-protein] ligase